MEIEKTFDHKKAGVGDKILMIGELEHIRRHALRSAASVYNGEGDEAMVSAKYLIIAKRAQEIRRDYMKRHFGDIKDEDWCLCKAAASLRQLAYETAESDLDMLKEIEMLVDGVWGMATGVDLSDCVVCRNDREAV